MNEADEIRARLAEGGYPTEPAAGRPDEYTVGGTSQASPPILVLNERALRRAIKRSIRQAAAAFGYVTPEDKLRGARSLVAINIEEVLETRIVRRIGYSATGRVKDTEPYPTEPVDADPEDLEWVANPPERD